MLREQGSAATLIVRVPGFRCQFARAVEIIAARQELANSSHPTLESQENSLRRI
jgi:hypothetical protein